MSNLKRARPSLRIWLGLAGIVVLGLGAVGWATAGPAKQQGPLVGARAIGKPGFGDLSLKQMLAARKSIPVPKKLPNFHGASVTVMGDAGHNMNAFGFWFPEWKKAGIKLKAVEVPFEDVYSKEKAEFIAGTQAVDLVVFYPAYIGDFAS